MTRIFMSHSSRDSRQAVALMRWLVDNEPSLAGEIFLDIDPDTGLAPGVRWRDALTQTAARCEAVVCLLSTDWESSQECTNEYRTAETLNKRIFCARLDVSRRRGRVRTPRGATMVVRPVRRFRPGHHGARTRRITTGGRTRADRRTNAGARAQGATRLSDRASAACGNPSSHSRSAHVQRMTSRPRSRTASSRSFSATRSRRSTYLPARRTRRPPRGAPRRSRDGNVDATCRGPPRAGAVGSVVEGRS